MLLLVLLLLLLLLLLLPLLLLLLLLPFDLLLLLLPAGPHSFFFLPRGKPQPFPTTYCHYPPEPLGKDRG